MKISQLNTQANMLLIQALKSVFDQEDVQHYFNALSVMTISEFENEIKGIQKEITKMEVASPKAVRRMNGWLESLRELY